MYEFFKAIFYLFGFVAILYEIWKVQQYSKLEAMNEKAKLSMKGELDLSEDENKSFAVFGCLMCLYYLWCAVGIFSSQWPSFLLILLLSFINHKLWKGEDANFVDSLTTIALVLFAMLNTYHFHIKFF